MGTKAKWEAFFSEAGITSKLASEYAHVFYTNRMQLDMLDELNKELIHDLGIHAVGDVIMILRHAKHIAAEKWCKPSRLTKLSRSGSRYRLSLRSKKKSATAGLGSKRPVAYPLSTIKLSRKQSWSPENAETATHTTKPQRESLPKSPAPSVKSTDERSLPTPQTSKEPKAMPKPNVKEDSTVKPISEPEIKPVKKTMPASRSSGRRGLSDRFIECEKAAKRIKLEQDRKESEMQEKLKEAEKIIEASAKERAIKLVQKKVEPVFTVSVSAPPTRDDPHLADDHPQVTLVPAKGKPLFRTKPPSAIFDRLGGTGAKVVNETDKTIVSQGSEDRHLLATRSNTKGAQGSTTSLKRPAVATNQLKSNDAVFCRLGDLSHTSVPRLMREIQPNTPTAESSSRPVKQVAPFRDHRSQQEQGTGRPSVFSRLSAR